MEGENRTSRAGNQPTKPSHFLSLALDFSVSATIGSVILGQRAFIELFVYYESIKRELKIRCIYECRCDERLSY